MPTDQAIDAEIETELPTELPLPSDAEIAAMTPEKAQSLITAVEAAIAETSRLLEQPRPTLATHYVDRLGESDRARMEQLVNKVRNTKNRRKKRRAERALRQWKRKALGRAGERRRKLRRARRKWERRRSRLRRRADRYANRLAKLRIRSARRETGGGAKEQLGGVLEGAAGLVGGVLGMKTAQAQAEAAQAAGGDPSQMARDTMSNVANPRPMPVARQVPIGALAAAAGGLVLFAFLSRK